MSGRNYVIQTKLMMAGEESIAQRWTDEVFEQRRRSCRMSMSEMLTIVVHFHQKRFRDFKTY